MYKERAEKVEREHKAREERRAKEREKELALREERRKEQEKREKERRERARKEAERVRKEREKQRELEKQRENEREKERERFLRERREKEEKLQREREQEREQLEKERLQRERDKLERERLDRERKERERLENERIERERQERERLERERLERERIDNERSRLEKERLERERHDRDRRPILIRGVERGSDGFNPLKRSADHKGYPDNKRSARDDHRDGRNSFFGSSHNEHPRDVRSNYVTDDVYDVAYQRKVAPVTVRNERNDPRSRDDPRRRDARVIESVPKGREYEDIRRVVDRYPSSRDPPSRDRSPRRGIDVPKYRENGRSADYSRQDWLEAPNPNAPKTLSDVLGRAGLTGILGSQAESNNAPRSSYSPRRDGSSRDNYSTNPSTAKQSVYKLDNRVRERADERQSIRQDDRREYRDDGRRDNIRSDDRRDARVDDRGRDSRPDTRRDSHLIEHAQTIDARRDSIPRDRRDLDYRGGNRTQTTERRETRGLHERRDSRGDERQRDFRDERRDSRQETKTMDRGFVSASLPPSQDSVTERRGLHPLAADLSSRSLTAVLPTRVVSVPTDVFGRPVQSAPAPTGLSAGYTTASQPIPIHQVPTGIQYRDGRLEFTRIAPAGANIQPFPGHRF